MNRGTEVATIDCALVTITTASGEELALDTANKISVAVASETTDAVKLIVKGKLLAQKKQQTTITGNDITLTDNVFNYELAKILQGGTIMYYSDSAKSESSLSETKTSYGVAGYDAPKVGSNEKGEVFELNSYSAVYNEAGILVEYEKITYPNCTGNPFGLDSEDNVFRVPEYTINSAPTKGQSPYKIRRVSQLPVIE